MPNDTRLGDHGYLKSVTADLNEGSRTLYTDNGLKRGSLLLNKPVFPGCFVVHRAAKKTGKITAKHASPTTGLIPLTSQELQSSNLPTGVQVAKSGRAATTKKGDKGKDKVNERGSKR